MRLSKWLLVSLSFEFLVVMACVHSPKADIEADRKQVATELSGEMSLKADRDQLKELRREIPADKQKANDEMALYLQLMKQGTEQPQVVRDKFGVIVQRKRAAYREKVRRLRESYHASEAKRRNEFLGEQQAKRDSYLAAKRTPDQTRDFFASQDKDRQAFFADERMRRQAFEEEINSQGQDFEAYMRDKNNEFNEQYRLYAKQFSEKTKEKNPVTGDTPTDFKQLDKVPAKTLSTQD